MSDASEQKSEIPGGVDRRRDGRVRPGRLPRRVRPVPLLRLSAYYLLLTALLGAMVWAFPLAREAFLSPIAAPVVDARDPFGMGGAGGVDSLPAAVPQQDVEQLLARAGTTLLIVLGSLALALPVAWVYMFTKRLRYDSSLVQSVIILPVVVAGILIVVKESLAVAFSLAGIVAAVRFRNTLKDPKDAVYIFLALGMGVASGVQALDIALVVSLSFNAIVLALWKYNVGAIYSNEYGARGILAVGDRRLMVARTPGERRLIVDRVTAGGNGKDADGILLVQAPDPDQARHAVEASLSQVAKDWTLTGQVPGPRGTRSLEFLIEMKKKKSVVELLGDLDDRWAAQVAAAEFIPFDVRTAVEDEDDDDDD